MVRNMLCYIVMLYHMGNFCTLPIAQKKFNMQFLHVKFFNLKISQTMVVVNLTADEHLGMLCLQLHTQLISTFLLTSSRYNPVS